VERDSPESFGRHLCVNSRSSAPVPVTPEASTTFRMGPPPSRINICCTPSMTLYLLFIILFYLLHNSISIAVAMFVATFLTLVLIYYVSADKRNLLRVHLAILPVMFFVSLFLSINPQTNHAILSFIGFRSPGPVEILADAKIGPIFSNIQGMTIAACGEYLLIRNAGIAFRSTSQTIIEAPYSRFSVPPQPKQLISIKSEDVKAILQNPNVIPQ
jgi:hypothetical protein